MRYQITKLFIGGILAGLYYTEITTVAFREGQVVDHPVGGSPYRIVMVVPLDGAVGAAHDTASFSSHA